MRDPESKPYKYYRRARLFKVLIRVDGDEGIKDLVKLVKGFMKREGRTQYVVIYKYLNHQQVAALKRQYGDRVKLILEHG